MHADNASCPPDPRGLLAVRKLYPFFFINCRLKRRQAISKQIMKADNFIVVGNKGQAIASTNYFDTEQARGGLVYLTWNAGAGRLLIPDNLKRVLPEMRSAKYVIVSSGPWMEHEGVAALELLFEDRSDSPFVMVIPMTQSDRHLVDTNQLNGFYISVWTRGGQKLRLPGRYRKVASLPCLEEWNIHRGK